MAEPALRQRAGGLASVRVGALADFRVLAEDQEFWTSTLAGVLGGILAVMGLFALGLAWIRRLDYLMYFGLLTTGWSLATARFWLTELPAPNAAVEVLIAMMFAPLVGCAVQFVLCYAGARLQPIISEVWMWRVRAWLWVQCALVPLTLVWLGFDRIFLGVSLWYPIFAIEICAGISYFLLAAGKRRRPEFWLMSVIMGVVVAVTLAAYLALERLSRSPWGRVLKGIREDEDAVRSLGKSTYLRKMQALILGGIFGTLGGVFWAVAKQSVQPDSFVPAFTFFCYTILILGGAARVMGPVVGAIIFWFLLVFIEQFLLLLISNGTITFLEPTQVGLAQVRVAQVQSPRIDLPQVRAALGPGVLSARLAGSQNALMPVSSRPTTSWCTVSVPS